MAANKVYAETVQESCIPVYDHFGGGSVKQY